MSAATRTGPSVPAAETPAGPVPRRVRPPRWLDLRLVLGVLLVLGSVLLGARVLATADATVPVWSVTADLAAGTVLAPEDLAAVDVRLGDAAGAYLSTGTDPAGRTLARAVRAGELLPRTVLEEPEDLVQVALPVQSGYVPPGLARGAVVDVYGVTDPAGTTTGEGVVPVVGAAPVQAVSGRAEGVLSSTTTTVQVVVAVPADEAPHVLAAIGGRPLVVVVHGSVDGAAPTTAPRPAAASPSPSPSPTPAATSSTPAPSTAPTPPPVADPVVPPVAVDPAAPAVDPAAGVPAAPAA